MAGPNFWGYTTQPAQTFGSRLGGDFAEVLQSLATDKAHQVKTNQNKRFLQSLGLRPDIAASLAPHSDENIFKFLSNFEGFDIGNPQQQMNPQQLLNQQNPAQVAPNNMQNQPNPGQNTAQNNQNDVNGMLKQLYTDYPELRNQIGPEQLGQLLQNQATQQALNPLGIQSKGIRSKGPASSADQELKREKFEQEKQDTINKKYAKQIEQFEKDNLLGSQIVSLSDELLDLNEQIGDSWNPQYEGFTQGVNKLSFGLIDPRSAIGEAGEVFRTKTNEVVDLTANAIKGIASKYRVSIKEGSKPSLNQTYEARKRNILDLKKRGEVLQIPYDETLKVLENNNGLLPYNFGQLAIPVIKQKQEEVLKGNKKFAEEAKITDQSLLKKLGAPSKMKPGKAKEDEETGEIYFVKNGTWFKKG